MPALLSPLDDALVTAFHDGDEHAFEQLVHARFDPLVARARDLLGDDAPGAPRVAIAALTAAWNERARFASAIAIDDFLDDALPHLVADERRRRAALHRFEHREGVPAAPGAERAALTADAAWETIAAKLHVSDDEIAQHREEARRTARRHAREHVETVASRRIPVGAIAVGAVLVLGLFGISRFMDRGGAEVALTRALDAGEVRVLQSAPGQRGRITLLDESTAQLGAASSLRIPKGFASTLRGLRLDGAARFTVREGGELPFQVRVKDASVVVTGTDFVVRGYADEPEVFVQVREGSVRVHPKVGDGTSTTVRAGEAIVLDATGAIRPLAPAEVARAFSWADGSLRLEDTPLEEAVQALKRWHGLEVRLGDPSLGARRVTTTLSLASDGVALDSLIAAGGLEKVYDGKQVVLYPLGAAPAPVKPAKPARRR